MKKTEIRKKMRGLFNCSRFIGGIHVCNVAWKNFPYMIIENYQTFDDAKGDKFTPILYFKTQYDLIEQLYKSLDIK
jgi:hypothetical protein